MFDFNNNSYGCYSTKKITDFEFFGNAEAFVEDYRSNPLYSSELTDEDLKVLYYLIYGKYGNSHIANSDVNQFKFKFYSVIFQYAPVWKKKLEIQKKLRTTEEAELMKGTKAIYNHSYNPSSAPSTSSLDELTTINEQNTNSIKKSKLDVYSTLMVILEEDITEEFLQRFKPLFLVVVEPQSALLYRDLDDDEEVK